MLKMEEVEAVRDSLRAAELRRKLAPMQVYVFPRLRSTQSWARQALNTRRFNGPALVVASRQTSGRGRGTNRWWADAGSLCVTFIRPAACPPGQVSLRAALAVCEALEEWLPPGVANVKWPNDVLVKERKIAGILCERAQEADLIGIGLNVGSDLRRAPAEVQRRAITLNSLARTPPRRQDVLIALARALDREWGRRDWLARYVDRSILVGRRVEIDVGTANLSGICEGFADDGRLILNDGVQTRFIANGTVLYPGKLPP